MTTDPSPARPAGTGSARFEPREGRALAGRCTLGVGGPARWFARAATMEHVAAAHAWAADRGLPLFILGGGSNIVVADEGFDGVVLEMGITGVDVAGERGRTRVAAGAGEAWDPLVAMTVGRGLAGLECLSGIPGTVGGTPIQNVGAYGQQVSDVLSHVTAFDRATAGPVEIAAAECGFAYRTSRFKTGDSGRFVVCGVTFDLAPGPPRIAYADLVDELATRRVAAPELTDVREAVLRIRRRKGMVVEAADPDSRSVGSFFMNPVVPAAVIERLESASLGPVPRFAVDGQRARIPAAWLIERAGFRKGHAAGSVGLSTKHPLAIVNRGGATAGAVLDFAAAIKRAVVDACGVWLRCEPVFVGLDGDPRAAFLQRAGD